MNSLITLINEGMYTGALSLYSYSSEGKGTSIFGRAMTLEKVCEYLEGNSDGQVRLSIPSDNGQPWEGLEELEGEFVTCDEGEFWATYEFSLGFIGRMEDAWLFKCNSVGCDFTDIYGSAVCPDHGIFPAREVACDQRMAFESVLRQVLRYNKWLEQRADVKKELLALVGEEFDRLESLGLAQEAFEASDRGTTIRHTVRAPAFMSNFSKKLHEAVCQRSGCKRNAKQRMDGGFLVCDVHGKKVTK